MSTSSRLRGYDPVGILLLFMLLGSAALAQCPPGLICPAPPPNSSGDVISVAPVQAVRVRCRQPSGDSIGTATLIAQAEQVSYWVTCAHLFDEGSEQISLQRPSRQLFRARLVRIDRANDLALLASSRVNKSPIPYQDSLAGPLTAGGYGPHGRWRSVKGALSGYATPRGGGSRSLKLLGTVRPGDSGGPVLNSNGRLCGVVWGQRDGETYASFGAPLRKLLSGIGVPAGSREQVSLPDEGARSAEDPSSGSSDPVRPGALLAEEWRTWKGAFNERLSRAERRLEDSVSGSELKKSRVESRSRFAEIRERLLAISQRAKKGTKVASYLLGLSRIDLAIGGLAIGGPIGVSMLFGRLLLGRRSSRLPSESPASSRSSPVVVDSPPPPQQVVPETHYVSYERDEFARAYQWASEQTARKYPGSVDWLTGLDSLIKQKLASDK